MFSSSLSASIFQSYVHVNVSDYVSELRLPTGLLFIRQMIHGMESHGGTMLTGEQKVPLPHSPPQIPRGLNWGRSRASEARWRRLTA
jgi:hypothetical protein